MTAGIQVTLDLDEIAQGYARHYGDDDAAPMTLMDGILALAAQQVLAKIQHDDVVGAVRDRVRAIRDEAIQERVGPLVESALTAAIQPTNGYGQPQGGPTTLSEIIVAEATKYLTTKHSLNGQYNGTQVTAVQEFILGEVKRVIDADLKGAMEAARAEVGAAVREQAAALIQETIAKMAGVQR